MIAWVKKNQLITLIVIVLVAYFFSKFVGSFFGFDISKSSVRPYMSDSDEMGYMADRALPPITSSYSKGTDSYSAMVVPQPDIIDRKVIQNSSLSLVVKNVRQSLDQIINLATQAGGYMVNSSLSQPEEAPYATVAVRVPSDNLQELLQDYRGLSVKVASEQLSGYDVTDQYVDIQSRLSRLRTTKARFERIMDQAEVIDEILRVQQEIFNLQTQIDQLVGQQQYLEQTSKTVLVTISLSSDELALPYAPTGVFRPSVTFKLAVRSLVQTLRGLTETAIWVGVYAAIWLPLVIFALGFRYWIRLRKTSK